MSDPELRSRWAELKELDSMVRQRTLTALTLSPGLERRESLLLIGSFRDRIAAIKQAEIAVQSMKMHCFRRTA
jgi:hypothetical protein